MRSKFVCYIVVTTFVLANWTAAHGCTHRNREVKEQIDIVATATSPGNDYVATVYTVWGGGAAGYVYKVINLRKQADTFDPNEGVIFSVTGTREVTFWWEDNDHLMVKHSKAGNIYIQAEEWGNGKKVSIRYVVAD